MSDFTYDLDRMKAALNTPYCKVPHFDTKEELLEWMESDDQEWIYDRLDPKDSEG